jgi:hypothetical protein
VNQTLQRRRLVCWAQDAFELSERRACQASAPSSQESAPAPPDHEAALAPVAEGVLEAINSGEPDRFDELMTSNVKRIAPDQNAYSAFAGLTTSAMMASNSG